MQHYQDVLQDRSGNAIAGAIVTVLYNSTSLPADLYSDYAGTQPLTSIVTDADGSYSFYVSSGRYDYAFYKNGKLLKTETDVFIDQSTTLQDLSAPTGAALVGFNPAGTVSAPTVQAAIEELDAEKVGFTTLAATTGATLVGITPAGNIAATTVATAINELDTEKVSLTALAATTGTIGASLVGFQQNLTGATPRTVNAKIRDVVSFPDFGADPTGTADSTDAINAAITASNFVINEKGTFLNSTANVTLPFKKCLVFKDTSDINSTLAGSFTGSGVVIRENYNPSSMTGWTDTSASYNYSGLYVDFGGYGKQQFGIKAIPTGISGAIKVPSTSTIANHASGVSGYSRSASTTTGAVALYGEAVADATNAMLWGINTRSIDNGVKASVWGAEIDLNITNVGSDIIGVTVVGGSTVEPVISMGFRCNALGVFATPKKRWRQAFISEDGAAFTGLQLGTSLDVDDGIVTSSASQPITMYCRPVGSARTLGAQLLVDATGNFIIKQAAAGALLALQTQDGNLPIKLLNGNQISFYGGTPIGKQNVIGAKGGNAALGSLITILANLGLLTDGTTA